MKRSVTALGLLLLASSAHAQSAAHTAALAHLNANRAQMGLAAADYADLSVVSEHLGAETGLTHLYLQQRASGIPLRGAISSVAVQANGHVFAFNSRLVPGLAARVNGATPGISAAAAVAVAAASKGLTPVGLSVVGGSGGTTQHTLFSTAGISKEPIEAHLLYEAVSGGLYRLAWQVEIYTLDAQHDWLIRVDAASSAILSTEDRVINDHWGEGEGARVETDAHLSPRPAPAARRALRFDLFDRTVGPVAPRDATAARPFAPGTYRVFDRPNESPLHAGSDYATVERRSLVTTSGDATASPSGWHQDNVTSYTFTKGNNVFAYIDSLGVEAGFVADGGASLNFDFPIDYTKQPGTYAQAAVTNLFYWSNIMHDVYYRYGFTEAAGNFQATNFGRGGATGNDAVLAQAQDGGGTNNANFRTLPDGEPGIMQMYLWTPSIPGTLRINAPGALAGQTFVAQEAAFGPPFGDPGLTGDIAYSVTNPTACGLTVATTTAPTIIPEFNGKVALIDRGGCDFVLKARNAQLSGAIGMIVANHTAGAGVLTMGSSNPAGTGPDPVGMSILIPSGMVSYETGLTLKANLSGLNGTLLRVGGPVPMRDGDIDNGIIAHEYGHGINHRLTGGRTGCLSNEERGDEGWADFHGLMMTMKATDTGPMRRGIGTYTQFQTTSGGGIRPRPYSTDMTINEYTYGDINNPEISAPHGVGFVWASMIWDMTWKYIDRYGFNPDITALAANNQGEAGNIRALKVVVTGLKLQACNPGFVDARNAILQADKALYGGVNHDIIWEAFARRGLGYSATQGSSASRADGVEAFDLPDAPFGKLRLVHGAPSIAQDGTSFTYTLTATNTDTVTALNGVVLRDTLDARLVVMAGSVSDGGTVSGNVITWPAVNLAPEASVTRTYSVFVAAGDGATFLFQDDMEGGATNWTVAGGPSNWTQVSTEAHSGTKAWFVADTPDNPNLSTLTLSAPVTLTASSVLSFWHKYATEPNFDGGVVEISTDGGLTWTDLGPYMTQNGYGPAIPAANNPTLPDRRAFHGGTSGYVNTLVNLGSFAGAAARIRFLFSADVGTAAVGWHLDDVSIMNNPVAVTVRGALSHPSGDVRNASSTIVTAAAEPFMALTGNAWLAGAYEGGTGLMRNDLNTGGFLPTTQPYGDAAYNGTPLDYDGAETVAAGFFAARPHLVDWVLVELRGTTSAGTTVSRQPAFLTRDGQIVALDGTSPLVYEDTSPAQRYVVVRHRNHLAVMSATAVAPSGALLRHSFTTAQAQAYGGNGQCALSGGAFALCTGDVDGNGTTTYSGAGNDRAHIFTRVGSLVGTANGYYREDLNLNGTVSYSGAGNDRALVFTTVGSLVGSRGTGVPQN